MNNMNNMNNTRVMQQIIQDSILAEAARKAAAAAEKPRRRIIVKAAEKSSSTNSIMNNKEMQTAIQNSITSETKRKKAANNNATQELLQQLRKNNEQISSNSILAWKLQYNRQRTPSPKLTQKKRPLSPKAKRPLTPPKAKATPPKEKRPSTPSTVLNFLTRSSKVAPLLIAPINQYRITYNDKQKNMLIPNIFTVLLTNEENRIQLLKSTKQITFCEAQESAGCGRHAINNLLGGVFFVKIGGCIINNDNYTQRTFTIPINMPSLCAFLVTRYPLLFSSTIVGSNCPDSENYLYSVIVIALNMLGYMVNEEVINGELYTRDGNRRVVKINDNNNADNFIGFIANINKWHWICYRKLSEGNYLELNSFQCSSNLYNEVSFDYITERAPIPSSMSHIGSARGIYQIYKVIFIGLDYREQNYSML